MKILLTHGYFLSEDEKEQLIMRPYVPLGILYISAYLEKNGYDNDVFDSTFQQFNTLTSKILTDKPDIIGIYTNLMTKVNVLRIIKFIKKHPELANTKIVLGGPEVRNHAQNFLLYGADIIILGEGELTMLEVVQAIEQGKAWNDIQSICFKDRNGTIIKTEERKLNKEIDQLPFPNRNKIDLNKYINTWEERHGYSSINVSTMRGCPYTCRWCSRAVYGQSYRRRKSELVVEEIKSLQSQYNFKNIWFVDDVFTVSHKWLQEFAEELEKQNVKVSYECISRADRLNEEVVQLLKRSGCFRVWIGAESGSQKIIDAMDRRIDVQDTREKIKLVKSYGIEAGTFIMLGYPGETEEDIIETVHHLKASQPDQFTITITYPIKGTPLYSEVEKDFLTNFPWDSSTDRDIDFKREYPRQYYEHAVKWVVNEVNASKHANKMEIKSALKSKMQAIKYKWHMGRAKKTNI
jgi:radical SAM superfamily enzyme YgiQ (UPF0313 family)